MLFHVEQDFEIFSFRFRFSNLDKDVYTHLKLCLLRLVIELKRPLKQPFLKRCGSVPTLSSRTVIGILLDYYHSVRLTVCSAYSVNIHIIISTTIFK